MIQISREQALGFLLSRQGLIEPFPDPITALDRLIAVQTQYVSSLPTALAARTRKITPSWHDRAERLQTVKSWSVRSTLHAHTRSNHALLVSAIGQQHIQKHLEWMQTLGMTLDDIESMQANILKALAAGPLTRPELHARVPALKNIPYAGWGLDLKIPAYRGQIRFIIADRGQTRFALSEPPPPMEPGEALGELIRRYFRSFGPATFTDFVTWAGIKQGPFKEALRAVLPELLEVAVDGVAGKRWILAADEESIQTAAKPKPLRLLAKFDPLSMGTKDRTLWLDAQHHSRVFRIAGQVEAVILVRGKAVGTWRVDVKPKETTIHVEPFKPLSEAVWKALEIEAGRMAKRLWRTDRTFLDDAARKARYWA